MRLFQEIEKCFPEMRKHRIEWLKRNPTLGDSQAKSDMILWIEATYLQENSSIYQLFWKAGVKTRRTMANHMLIWHMYDWNLETRK